MAQSNVYSLNIVGYANVPTPLGFTFQSNPLDASPSNSATNVIANPNPSQTASAGPWDSSNLQLWSTASASWSIYYFDSLTADTTTGFVDGSFNPLPTPTLGSGTGYLIQNGQAASNNITYVGTVRTGTNSIIIPNSSKLYAMGSPIPYSGGVSTALGLTNPNPTQTASAGPLDGASVQTANVSGGQFTSYTVAYFDSLTLDTTTGFVDGSFNPLPEPQIPIGGGFFVLAGQTSPYTWTQILNP